MSISYLKACIYLLVASLDNLLVKCELKLDDQDLAPFTKASTVASLG